MGRTLQHMFNGVLNRPSSINAETIQRLSQVDINPDLDIPLSEYEVAKVLKQMSTGKSSGPDAIPAEVFKSAALLSSTS